jgi:DNA (cytosine-5)-methyltransferase 1
LVLVAGLLVGDITEVDGAEVPCHDLLTAGFCCQSFSKAGLQAGLTDPRGQLFYEIPRLLRAARPRAFLLENVANLLLHDGGGTAAEVVRELESAG